MSGHNPPHGRLGQPNTTWNPLQVPSFVPRQPQLAHMSSERSMARSPLTWATPPTTHQDKVYSLMTGNLMNNLEINPLLQGYGRNVGMPLGSVDLSLSSASRSTPSPKGSHNSVQIACTSSHSSHTSTSLTTLPSNIPASGIHNMANESGHPGTNHQTRSLTSPNVAPTSGGVIQSTTAAAMKERMQNSGSASMNTNNIAGSTSHNFGVSNANSDIGARGGNGFGSSLNNRTANDLTALVSGGLLVKDAKQINSEMDSKNGRDCFSHLSGTDSSDLVKELVLHTMHCNALSVSPKRMSPTRSSLQSTLSPSRSRSPPLNLLLGASSMDGKLGMESCLNTAFPLPTTNASVPLSLNSDSTAPATTIENADIGSVTARAIGSLLAGSSEMATGPSSCTINPSASPTGNSMASSEDSVDSSNSRSNNARRRRKPERTNKMNAAFPIEEEKSLFPISKTVDGTTLEEMDSLRTSHTVRSDITTLAIEGINALSHGLAGTQCDDSQHLALANISAGNNQEGNGLQQDGSGHTSHDVYHPHHTQRKTLSEMPQVQQKLLDNLIQSNISSNITGLINSNLQATTAVETSNTSASSVTAETGGTSTATPGATILSMVHKQTSDDCETIDKIAAMVSSTDTKLTLNKSEPTNENGVAGNDTKCNGPTKSNAQVKSSLKAANKTANAANASDSSYEEVENKLEEMFAGIEELSEKCSEPDVQTGSVSKNRCRDTAVPTNYAPTNEDTQKMERSDDAMMAQLSTESVSGKCETNHANLVNSVPPGAGITNVKKPLTPAQKRSMGNKSQSGEMVTSTPAVKRKRGPKKKSNAHRKPFMEPEGTSLMGLKALVNNKKGKKGKAATLGTKGAGATGKTVKHVEREASAAAAVWPVGSVSSILDTGKYRGPFVQVKTDGSHTVINAPMNEEDSEKAQNKTKKFGNSLNSSERSKIRGLHVSTLSTKYDADTTDMSWMCVFCKTGPHKFRLGDLFGPYIISTKSSEFEQSQVDLNFFSVRRTRESLESQRAKENRAAELQKEQQQQELVGPKSKKRKNASTANATGPSGSKTVTPKDGHCDDGERSAQQSAVEIFYGMMKAGDHTYEVWTHEDCLVWAPGVHMVGTRIVGLEAAIWNCCRHLCQLCNHYGAVLNCLHQGCQAKAHYICAHKQNWKLTDGFQAFCTLHGEKDQHEHVENASTCREDGSALPPTKQPKKMAKCSKEEVNLATSAS
uniref:PHD-type domain-containing protein n=1 Tax=Anopheles farauti TaxID=69004 RepID=A0A182QWC5_9DIPT